MHLQKLVEVLKQFDEEKLRRLDEYVRSPYFKVPPVCVLLLNRLMPLHPKYIESKMQWQKLGKKDATLSTIAKQRNAATGLLKAIDGFIALEQLQLNKPELVRLKLKGYKELKLEDKFEEGFNEQMTFLENDPEQDIDTFYEKHMLIELSMQGVAARSNRTIANDIRPVINTLDEFYALKKICYMCEAINRQQVLGVTYNAGDISQLLNSLLPYSTHKHPYVYLYVNVFKMMSEKTFEGGVFYYNTLKQFIETIVVTIVPASVKEIVEYIFTWCVSWYNKGFDIAAVEYIWWIEWRVKYGLLHKENVLMPVTFRNVVRVAVQSKKNPDWIKEWIDTQIAYLPEVAVDVNYAYAQGLYLYSIKQYLEAIRFLLLAQVKNDMLFNCSLRVWQWMCLYEYDKEDIETLYNNLLAFEKYINRYSKVLKHRSRLFELFISYSFKLIKSSVGDADSVITQIVNDVHFASKSWLLLQYRARL